MKIYVVSKGEGKNLHTKTAKFFATREKAEAYRKTLDKIGTYERLYNENTKSEIVWYVGHMTERDKNFRRRSLCTDLTVDWFEDVYNPYTITEIEVEE